MTLSPAPTAGTSDISVYDRLESRVRSYSRAMPRQFVRAEGPWMHDTEGGRYLDFLSGCSTLNYGHNHPVLKKDLMDYIAGDAVAHSLDIHTEAKAGFLEAVEKTLKATRGIRHKTKCTGT